MATLDAKYGSRGLASVTRSRVRKFGGVHPEATNIILDVNGETGTANDERKQSSMNRGSVGNPEPDPFPGGLNECIAPFSPTEAQLPACP